MALYRFGHCVESKDLQHMAESIESSSGSATTTCKDVKYVCAPNGFGKTTSVLPAFLQSDEATHYLYLAFRNNGDRNFVLHSSSEVSSMESIAERQGAFYITQCVKNLIEAPDDYRSYSIPLLDNENELLSCAEYSKKLEEYLSQKLGTNHGSIWFHIDEFCHMLRKQDFFIEGVPFFKGAMQTLASGKKFRVVLCDSKVPNLISPTCSTTQTIRRVPVPIPIVDVDKVMQTIPSLYINSTDMTEDEQRIFASIKFRLGCRLLEPDGMLSYLHQPHENLMARTFLHDFENHAKVWNDFSKTNRTERFEALKECNSLCIVDERIIIWNSDVGAARVLLGFSDTEDLGKTFRDGIVSPDSKLTGSMLSLLRTRDLNILPFNYGRSLLRDCLTHPHGCLMHTPLEAAYLWTLSSKAAVEGHLHFMEGVDFRFKCSTLLPARMIPHNRRTKKIDLMELGCRRDEKQIGPMFFSEAKPELGERKDIMNAWCCSIFHR
jgi:CheY-like chemotaxis protein